MCPTDAENMNTSSGFNSEQDTPQTYAEVSARLRTLLRLQNVARLLLAGGPGDFFGKKQAARLGQKRGMAELKNWFEHARELFRASFEPIIMEMYGDAPRLQLTIPNPHGGREIGVKLLKIILDEPGISRDEWLKAR